MTVNYDEELNPQQREAVFHKEGPALVVAGAGTGKTRTLIYRVARLVEQKEDPRRILLLTFTRRASQEMLRRAADLLRDKRVHDVSGGTFHAFAHTILRRHGKSAGVHRNFTILDRSDSEDIIQHLRTELGFAGGNPKPKAQNPKKRFPKKRTLNEIISKAVNTRTAISDLIEQDWPQFIDDTKGIVTLADRYRVYKHQNRLLDYDDLLVALERLLTHDQHVRARLSEYFRNVLVDEYQDTNRLQSDILRSLARHRNVMAVGDEAQAIYSFRGADFRNIMAFPKDFPGAVIYKIEENYRSTQPVLNAANAVIGKASKGYEKELFTTRKEAGEAPKLVGTADEAAQASFIADAILELYDEDVALNDMAVLFRASYHSFELEAELMQRNIPFVKYGGFKFAEATHVKDAMAHLRWLVNPKDLVAAQRCLLLLEGVGPVTARSIADTVARAKSLVGGLADITVPGRTKEDFDVLKRVLAVAAEKPKPSDQLEALLPYLTKTIQRRFDDFPKRMRDLEHLVNIAKRFRSTERFVSDFSIDPPADHTVTGVTGVANEEEPLVLSTVHSAKGLEWHAVFVLSVLDGYLPQDYAFRSQEELEEERRLLYVAMTRAKDILTLTYPSKIIPGAVPSLRMPTVYAKPSHFLDGIPEEVLPHTILAPTDFLGTISYDDEEVD